MAPRRRAASVVEPEAAYDPIQDVIDGEVQDTADELGGILNELATVAGADSNVKVYKMADRTGKWAWIKDLTPPIEGNGLLEELRRDWGGGDYFFRTFAKGRIVSTRKVSIAGDPNPQRKQGNESNEILPLLISQMQSSKSDSMQMMTMMMQSQQQAAQQQSQMLMGLMTALIPVMAGNKGESPSQMLSAFAQMQQTLAPAKSDTPMSELIATMAAVKELMGDGGGGGGDDSFLSTAAKSLLPMLAKGVESAANQNPGSPLNTMRANHPPPMMPPRMVAPPQGMGQGMGGGMGGGMMRPNPSPPPLAYPPVMATPSTEPAPMTPDDPILALIADDVRYFLKRRLDPALAAEAVVSILSNAGVSDSDLLPLVLSYQTADDWREELAAKGLDLRQHAGWADEFIAELVAQWQDRDAADTGTGDDPERPDGGEDDFGDNGDFSP